MGKLGIFQSEDKIADKSWRDTEEKLKKREKKGDKGENPQRSKEQQHSSNPSLLPDVFRELRNFLSLKTDSWKDFFCRFFSCVCSSRGRRSRVELLFPPGREGTKLPSAPRSSPSLPEGNPRCPSNSRDTPAAEKKLWSQQEAGWDSGEPRRTGPGGSGTPGKELKNNRERGQSRPGVGTAVGAGFPG